ncbi:MAG: hypothetical protein JO210_11660 [Acidobacteriaceae bacterium]|nr:hypothetical protein [Acidobacteriaceae bacterium]
MAVTAESSFQFLGKAAGQGGVYRVPNHFQSGVSLHSHTMFSEESLDVVPRYTAKLPYVGNAVQRMQTEHDGGRRQRLDFSQAFWTPPLSPRQAYRVEEKQIQRQFNLPALVSLTDHDDTRAAALLRILHRFRNAPVSTEWTVPFESTFFHLGVHNLPTESAKELQLELAHFTSQPAPDALTGYLRKLNSFSEVLVVLNHPLWDEKGVGTAQHRQSLMRLIAQHGRYIHALELNGLRSWPENGEVIALARQANFPVISGGDRHGREPNAVLNLSRASEFAAFVAEVRYERKSHVVFMPQYREPLRLRVLQTIVDVLRDYPENAQGRRVWSDRVFYRDPLSGSAMPFTAIWRNGAPCLVRHFIRAMQLLEWHGIRSALRLALDDRSARWSEQQASL